MNNYLDSVEQLLPPAVPGAAPPLHASLDPAMTSKCLSWPECDKWLLLLLAWPPAPTDVFTGVDVAVVAAVLVSFRELIRLQVSSLAGPPFSATSFFTCIEKFKNVQFIMSKKTLVVMFCILLSTSNVLNRTNITKVKQYSVVLHAYNTYCLLYTSDAADE